MDILEPAQGDGDDGDGDGEDDGDGDGDDQPEDDDEGDDTDLGGVKTDEHGGRPLENSPRTLNQTVSAPLGIIMIMISMTMIMAVRMMMMMLICYYNYCILWGKLLLFASGGR